MQKNRKMHERSHHKIRLVLELLPALSMVGLVVFFVFFEPTIPRGASLTSWSENGRDGRYVLNILDGDAPPAGVQVSGVVLSDTNCTPDLRGFNHCHNGIQLADGVDIVVINTHRMKIYRCLRPGDKLLLSRINGSWVLATLLKP